jgi:hypothetical protein
LSRQNFPLRECRKKLSKNQFTWGRLLTILKPASIHVLRSTEARGQLLVATEAELDVLTNAGIEVQDLLEKLARAVLAGKRKKIRYLVHTILNSPAAKLSALVRTIDYDAEAPPYTLAELLQRVRGLFPYAPVPEPVSLRFKEKDSGELRSVLCFGWQRRALQKLCGDILKVLLPAYSFDFMEKGNGGPDGAAKYLGAIIKEGQYDFVVTADIKNCFRSVNKAGIAQLLSPLPTPVTNNVLLIMDDITLGKETYDLGDLLTQFFLEADTAARQGIPQGSSASNLIMSRAVLGPLLNATPFAGRVLLHGDDIAVPAKTEEEAEAIYQTLRSELENNGPAGPLTIGFHKIWCVDKYVNFCKYKLRRTSKVFGAEIRYCPSTRSFHRYERNVVKIYLQAPNGEEKQHVAQYSEAWKKAFGALWQPNELGEDMLAVTTINAMSHAWKIKNQASTKCTQ